MLITNEKRQTDKNVFFVNKNLKCTGKAIRGRNGLDISISPTPKGVEADAFVN